MLPKIKQSPQYIISVLIWALIIALGSGSLTLGFAQCDKELAEAEQKYNSGQFDEAIQLISGCLEKPTITENEKKQAYRLLGLTYIAQDYLKEAKAAVRRLLDLIPNYKADTVQDPPTFANLVEEVRNEMASESEPVQTPQPVSIKKEGDSQISKRKPTRFGFRGGLNMADITEDIGDYGDKKMRTTFGAGGIVEFWFSPMFAIQTNALYSLKGAVFEVVEQGETVTVTFKLTYFSFPILGKVAFGEGSSAKPFIIFGPEIGFLSSAKIAGEALGVGVEFDLKELGIETESVEFSINFGAGVDFPLGSIIAFVEGRYGLGLTQWNKEGNSVKNNVIYVNIGLLFGGN